jgi:hypothetical protein
MTNSIELKTRTTGSDPSLHALFNHTCRSQHRDLCTALTHNFAQRPRSVLNATRRLLHKKAVDLKELQAERVTLYSIIEHMCTIRDNHTVQQEQGKTIC